MRYEREPDWLEPQVPVEETSEECAHCFTPSDAPRDGEPPPLVRRFLRRWEVSDGYRCGKCARQGQPKVPPPCRCVDARSRRFAACIEGIHMIEVIGLNGDKQLRAAAWRSPGGKSELDHCPTQEPFWREKRMRFIAARKPAGKPEGM